MNFIYKARNKEGKLETGVIEASSKDGAAELLQKYNVFVTYLEEQKNKKLFFFNDIGLIKKVSKKELAMFFNQLSIMLESRVSMVQSLNSLSSQINKKSFREAVNEISSSVQEGVPLSDSFAAHPEIFDNFYVNLIKSGEASGKIAQSLHYVSEHLEKESDISAQIRQAMAYPVFVIAVLFVVIAIIITQLMPKIADLVKETGVEPSFFTSVLLNFYGFLSSYWWVLAILVFIVLILAIYYLKTDKGMENYNKISLKTPILRDFLKKVFLVRFCSNVSALLVAGISINRALGITGETVSNPVYKSIISDIEQKVSEGEKMSQIMDKHRDYFPPFVAQMVKVGEDTGKLDRVLVDVVNFYQKEIERTINLFSALLEPIIIIFLGVIITLLASSVLSLLYGAVGTI